MKRIVIMLVVSLALASCNKSDENKNGGSAAEPTKVTSEPVKDDAVRLLRAALAALEAKDYDKAATLFQGPPGGSPEEMKKQLARLLELQELSKTGIDILARDGKWGKLDQAFDAERAKRISERAGVPMNACYGLTLRNAEAGFYWDGKQIKIIRCDDIGKLS